jgi:hypothetical protein
VHGAEEVDLHHAADDLDVGLVEGTQVGDARVVDQHVDAAEGADHRIQRRLAVRE